jgi:hypothetical protein
VGVRRDASGLDAESVFCEGHNAVPSARVHDDGKGTGVRGATGPRT